VVIQNVEDKIMNDIYCEIGKSKKAILSIDGRLISLNVSFDDDNDRVYFSFENIDGNEYCDCHLGSIAYDNQMKIMMANKWADNPIIPQKFCGYCSKKYPPRQEHIIQLIDYEEISVKTDNTKSKRKRKKNKNNAV
jgi:hypothetical protein